MDCFPFFAIGRYRAVPQPPQSPSTRTPAAARKTYVEPEFYGVYTGEYRTPVRERLRGHRSVPSRPDTSIPSKRAASSLLSPPRTPTMAYSEPECPGAPRKRGSRVRKLNQGQSETDEDILLDRKAIERAKLVPSPPLKRQFVNVTPDPGSPLRQSWGSRELAVVDSKLEAFLRMSGEHDRR